LYQSICNKVDLLRNSANDDFVVSIIAQLQPQIYLLGDVIFHIGQTANGMYFLQAGQVVVYNKTQEFCRLNAGDVFGEVALTGGQPVRTASVQSTTITDLLFLSKKAFDECLLPFPVVKVQIEEMAKEKRDRDVQREQTFVNAQGKIRMRKFKPKPTADEKDEKKKKEEEAAIKKLTPEETAEQAESEFLTKIRAARMKQIHFASQMEDVLTILKEV